MATGVESRRACLLLYGLADISFPLSADDKKLEGAQRRCVGTHVDETGELVSGQLRTDNVRD